MTARARTELARARQVVIFPEGTRRPPGAEPTYKPGVAYLYAKAGVACVPVALNSGLFWPRRSLIRFPGTILVEVLDPIPPGLDSRAFLQQLQTAIEEASTRLLRESAITDQESGSLHLFPGA
jgi:1-acyl-sn-glycerol-3-phosphate acyltransferase